jgi:hypothetical protein
MSNQFDLPSTDAALRELAESLMGMNYVVSFDLHHVPQVFDHPKQYVVTAFGARAKVKEFEEVSAGMMLAEVERCIRWRGDRGSHPNLEFRRTERFEELLEGVLAHLRESAKNSTIWSVWIEPGHPHYPVQWDFAFVLASSSGGEVFVGSSSD